MKNTTLALLLLALAGCVPTGKQTELVYGNKNDPKTNPVTDPSKSASSGSESKFDKAVVVMKNNCYSCHNADSTGRLFQMSQTPKEDEFISQKMVLPGNSADSVLVQRMQHSGNPAGNMPIYSTKFTVDDFNTVVNWIDGMLTKTEPHPTLTITAPADNSYFKTSFTLSGTCANGLPVELRLGAILQGTLTCTNGTFSKSISFANSDGIKLYSVGQTNSLGEHAEDSVSVTIDSLPPVLSVIYPQNNLTVFDTALSITGSCEPGLSVNVTGGASAKTFNCPSSGTFSESLTLANADGTRQLSFSQKDMVGNSSTVSLNVIKATKNLNAPNLVASSPAQGLSFKDIFTVTGKCEPGVPVKATGGVLAATDLTCPSNGSLLWNLTLSGVDGQKMVTLTQVKDGLTSSIIFSIIKDSTKPNVAVSAPADLTNINGPFSVSGSCENGTEVLISFTGLSDSKAVCMSGKFSQIISPLAPDATKTLLVSQTDVAGNSQSASSSVIYDTKAPALTITEPLAGASILTETAVLKGACETGLAITVLHNNISQTVACNNSLYSATVSLAAGSGDRLISVSQTDKATNVTTKSLTIMKALDSVANTKLAMDTLNKNCMSCHSAGSGRQFIMPLNPTDLDFVKQNMVVAGDSSKSLLVQRLKYSSGTKADMPIFNTTWTVNDQKVIAQWVDQMVAKTYPKPAIAISSPATGSYVKNSVTLTGTCTVGLDVTVSSASSTISTDPCGADGKFSKTISISNPDGAIYLSVSQKNDLAETDSKNITVNKDTVAPALAVSYPQKGVTIYDPSFSLSASCEPGLPVSVTGDVTPKTITCPTNGLLSDTIALSNANVDGVKNFTVTQTDLAMNLTTITLNVVKATKTAMSPKLAVTSPAQGQYFQNTVNVLGTCEPSVGITVSGGISGTTAFTCPSTGVLNINLTLSATDGLKMISLAQTSNNLTTKVDLTAYRDTLKPALTMASPVNLAYSKGSITVSGACESNITVTIQATGLANSTTTCTNGMYSKVLTLASPDGIKAITATQVDNATNSSSSTVNVTLDTLPPMITITAPITGSSTVDTSVTVKGMCENSLPVTIVNDTSSMTVSCASQSYSTALMLSSGLGDKTITVSQTDAAGNSFQQMVKITRTGSDINYATTARQILHDRCISCHASAWGTQLNADADLKVLVTNQKIIAGDPTNSPVIQKMYFGPNQNNNSVSKMPPTYATEYKGYTQVEYQAVYDYIVSIKPVTQGPAPAGSTTSGSTTGTSSSTSFTCASDISPSLNPMKRLSKIQYTNTLRDIAAKFLDSTSATSIMTNLTSQLLLIKDDAFKHDFPALDTQISSGHLEGYFEVAVKFGKEMTSTSARLTTLAGSCATNYADATCRNNFINKFGPVVLRHALSTEDRTKLQNFAATLSSYEELVAVILLESDFLYHAEYRGTDVSDSQLKLTAYELANRVSYLLFQSMPDDTLRAAADDGSILSNFSAVVSAAYDRARSKTFSYSGVDRNSFGHFMSGWMMLDEIPTGQTLNATSLSKTLTFAYPNKSTALASNLDLDVYRKEAIQEMHELYNYYAYDGKGSAKDLLTSKYSFAKTSNLAKAYGVSAWTGNTSSMISFPAGERSGILTRAGYHMHAGILSRPILKGVTVMRKILCEDIQIPAQNNTPDQAIVDDHMTVRERTHAITMIDGTACMSCHSRINPLGFATEDYDVLGRSRSVEYVLDYATGNLITTKNIDASSMPQLSIGDMTSVTGGVQYSDLVANSGKADACIVRNFHKYAYRQKEDTSRDSCSLEFAYNELKTGGLRGMMTGVARAPAFAMRYHDGEHGDLGNDNVPTTDVVTASPDAPADPTSMTGTTTTDTSMSSSTATPSSAPATVPVSISTLDQDVSSASVSITGACDSSLGAVALKVFSPSGVSTVATDAFDATTLSEKWQILDKDYFNSATPSVFMADKMLKIQGRGADLWGNSRSFISVHRDDLIGNFDISVKVSELTNINGSSLHDYAKAGLIIANDIDKMNDAGQGTFILAATGAAGVITNYNNAGTETGLFTVDTLLDHRIKGNAPTYLRIVRTGTTVQPYYKINSTDAWVAGNSYSIPQLAANVQVGLVALSHGDDLDIQASFDDFSYKADNLFTSQVSTITTSCNNNLFTASVNVGDVVGKKQITAIQSGVTDSISVNRVTASTSTTTTTTTTTTTPPASGSTVRVFAAVGHLGRFTMSCDAGKTWINDQSFSSTNRCWLDNQADPRYVECDHNQRPGDGVLISGGYLYTAYGWGQTGPLSRSATGKTNSWTTLINGTGRDLSVNGSVLMWGSAFPFISTDNGATWAQSTVQSISGWNVDYSGVVESQGGVKSFAMMGREVSGGREAAFSTDNGKSWQIRVIPADCGRQISTGNGITLFHGDSLYQKYCRSTDAGKTVTVYNTPNSDYVYKVIYTGTEFVGISSNNIYKSTNGINWTPTPIVYSGTTARINDPAITYDPILKVYVAVVQSWGNWYEKQKWLRSADGVTWSEAKTTLPVSGDGGHPIRTITSGEMPASACQ